MALGIFIGSLNYLRGYIADGELGEDNLGAGLVNALQLVVEDVPLGVDDLLVLRTQRKIRYRINFWI